MGKGALYQKAHCSILVPWSWLHKLRIQQAQSCFISPFLTIAQNLTWHPAGEARPICYSRFPDPFPRVWGILAPQKSFHILSSSGWASSSPTVSSSQRQEISPAAFRSTQQLPGYPEVWHLNCSLHRKILEVTGKNKIMTKWGENLVKFKQKFNHQIFLVDPNLNLETKTSFQATMLLICYYSTSQKEYKII